MTKRFHLLYTVAMVAMVVLVGTLGACSGKKQEPTAVNPKEDKGIGPVQSVSLAALDPQLAAKGQQLFQAKCSACHKIEEKYVGPALKGVTQRRTPEWIMNMILNPEEMTAKDPIAKDLLATHFTQMTFQNVSQEDVRSILEYFRQTDGAQ